MSSDLRLAASLRAWESGRPQRAARRLMTAVRSRARVLVALKLSGEDTTVHIVAHGRPGEPPTIDWVADPRNRDDQFALFERLADAVEADAESARAAGDYPQIVVPAGPNADHLDLLADRLRYQQVSARAKRLGELLTYPAERQRVEGQQSLIIATELLRRHWILGQAPGEDAHLGVLRTRLEPPPGVTLLDAVEAAEREPMGCTTAPDFDRDILAPRVEAYNRARRAGASTSTLAALSTDVRTALLPTVTRIYEATQWAIAHVNGLGLLPMPSLAALQRQEAGAFEFFMSGRDTGYPLTLRDKPVPAAYRIVERETALDDLEAAMRLEEPFARAESRLKGDVVEGIVSRPRTVRLASGRSEQQFDLVTSQPVLRARVGDTLIRVDEPKQSLFVEEIRRTAGTATLTLRVTAGMRSVALPAAGADLELAPSGPDWYWITAQRKQLKERLRTVPWTHDVATGASASVPATGVPANPLAAVEALR
ncbi:MAG: hypothetical protein IT305_12505 [Chloroflexi bacterium]|nr:hypothetical protein [Chloroflexota bacterium]